MLSAVGSAARQAAAAHAESEAGKVQPVQQDQELALQKAQVSSYLDHPLAIWLTSAMHSWFYHFYGILRHHYCITSQMQCVKSCWTYVERQTGKLHHTWELQLQRS